MNWTALGALAETLGAVGVILSLIYLATQVKHGATTARRAAGHEVMETTTPLLASLVNDREVASIWARGLQDFESLDPTERVRFSCLLLLLTYSWEEALQSFETGQLDRWAIQRFTASMEELARLPGFKGWFSVRSSWLSDEMRGRLEREMNAPAPDSPMYAGRGDDVMASASASSRA